MPITSYTLFSASPLEDFVIPVERVNITYNPDIDIVDIAGNDTAMFLCPFLKYEAPELRGGDKRIRAEVHPIDSLEHRL